MPPSENLLRTSLQFVRRARQHRQEEDFFTEILASLLERSPSLHERLLGQLFEGASPVVPNPDHWTIVTQEKFILKEGEDETTGVPDLIIRGSSGNGDRTTHLIAVEVKVDQPLEHKQLVKYHRWLESKRSPETSVYLGALTPARPARAGQNPGEALEFWLNRLTWEGVEVALKEVLKEGDGGEHDASFYTYATDFREVLAGEGLVAPTALEPAKDANHLRPPVTDKSRREEIGHLIKYALARGEVIQTLEKQGPWRRRSDASGVLSPTVLSWTKSAV